MRDNGPVNQRNREVPDNTFLVSRTDLRGVITWANQAFVAISGYSREELIGQPHNLIRHRDMPPAAFADLWATVGRGECWVGMVKNRCKNGDHYWVRASVWPETDAQGTVSGYVSVRVRPDAQEIAAAERAYARITAGDRNLSVARGRVVEHGIGTRLRLFFSQTRTLMALGFLLLITLVATTAVTGVGGMRTADAALHALYYDRLACTRQISTISQLTRENWALLADAGAGKEPGPLVERIRANKARISTELDTYAATNLTPEEKVLVDSLLADRKEYVARAIDPGIEFAEKNKKIALREILVSDVSVVLDRMTDTCRQLIDLQDSVGKALVDEQKKVYEQGVLLTAIFGIVAMTLAIAICLLLSRRLMRSIRAIDAPLKAIAGGKIDAALDIDRKDEFGRLLLTVALLQTRLGYSELRSREARLDLIADFDRAAGKVLDNLGSRISDLRTTADGQTEIAGQVAGNAQSVSTSATELSSSIREISNQASNVSSLSQLCAERTRAGVETMDRLAKAASEITSVAKLIATIAERTNLLALNATIEAAHAGEHGRGFAVVAGEVKSLASQTGNATGDINQRIRTVQADSDAAVTALREVSESVSKLTDAANAIAAAVEEQSSVVDEVARSAVQASASATATGEAAETVARASRDLAEGNQALTAAVAQFKSG